MAQEIVWHSIEATIAHDTETGVETIIAPPEAVTRATLDQRVRDAVAKGGTLDVDLARAVRLLIRMALGKYDAAT